LGQLYHGGVRGGKWVFLVGVGGLGRCGRFGLAWVVCGDCGGLGSVVLWYGTVGVLRFLLNRPRVGGCHGVCVNFSLLTAPSQFVSNLAVQLLLLFSNGFANPGLQLQNQMSTFVFKRICEPKG
jgi:hypothetical protein